MADEISFSCPAPVPPGPTIQLAHGGGGTLMHRLLEEVFFPAFGRKDHDGAVAPVAAGKLAFSTDSYVVRPLEFPGGDIGDLAVNGTVNDLAMCGAKPLWLSAGFILEEGLPLATLKRIVASMKAAADGVGVPIVTGDTKVVDRGKGDGVYVNTAGVGVVGNGVEIAAEQIQEGDVVIVSGDVGRHGIAIMAVREGLEFETKIESDCAPLVDPVHALLEAGIEVHCLRDLTRGGLTSALVEIAQTAERRIGIDLTEVPVEDGVRGACEILGLDPLYVANEGRFVAVVAARDAERAVAVLRQHEVSSGAEAIGSVGAETDALVTVRSEIGATRILDMLSGEQLPRIC